jgi:hypothetical protein
VLRNFLCGDESAKRLSGGRILPGDDAGGAAVMLRPISFHLWSLDLKWTSFLYAYIADHTLLYSVLTYAKFALRLILENIITA